MDETTGPEDLQEQLKSKTAKVTESATEAVDQARQTAKAAWEEAKSKVHDLRLLEAFVRENPSRAILVIFGIGFLTGVLCRK
jgi:ElaB/YqjD/DUF883 family membrane-anchored ribosome-binding protein